MVYNFFIDSENLSHLESFVNSIIYLMAEANNCFKIGILLLETISLMAWLVNIAKNDTESFLRGPMFGTSLWPLISPRALHTAKIFFAFCTLLYI